MVRDEDVVQVPVVANECTAASLSAALKAGGGWQADVARVPAKFRGTLISCDSAATNKLCVKALRQPLSGKHLVIASFCRQHRTGSAVAAVSKLLGVFTPCFCLANTWRDGDFHRAARARIQRRLGKLLHVVAPGTQLANVPPGNTDFAKAVVDLCLLKEGPR